ncbi:hypothetical protein DBR47_11910 [Paucibacter sp. KBW04]|uniref:YdcH family protein n=1 Tax=Paucibacter sp. KBW04 TaxID=2153361 RepID=UPI000F58F09C|nr:DUF465 domain-containing protein [Paucibacter sp. KBW04]RQO59345.1 hypothetical protein DBR47_11910 [Paucibacter sp. KBW04]
MHNSSLLPHALSIEFPELAERIKQLKQENAHFAKQLEAHDALDKQISQDELGVKAIEDHTLHAMKQQRARLKDELYQLAKG